MSEIIFKVRDYSDERSTVKFNITDVDETSWVATDTAIATLRAAMEALTIGTVESRTLIAYRENLNSDRPTDPNAQVESGLRLHYVDDDNGKKYFLTIPCPDKTILAQPGTDLIDLTGTLAAALVAAIEAVAVSPDGNSITVERGVLVGRNR